MGLLPRAKSEGRAIHAWHAHSWQFARQCAISFTLVLLAEFCQPQDWLRNYLSWKVLAPTPTQSDAATSSIPGHPVCTSPGRRNHSDVVADPESSHTRAFPHVIDFCLHGTPLNQHTSLSGLVRGWSCLLGGTIPQAFCQRRISFLCFILVSILVTAREQSLPGSFIDATLIVISIPSSTDWPDEHQPGQLAARPSLSRVGIRPVDRERSATCGNRCHVDSRLCIFETLPHPVCRVRLRRQLGIGRGETLTYRNGGVRIRARSENVIPK